MSQAQTLKQTPLHQEHLALGAKMVPFGGWDMPLQYEGILAEHQETRRDVTVFDTSHMGEFFIRGDAAGSGLENLVTQRLSDMPLRSCRYGALLNEKGGVIDDLIVYRIEKDYWMVVVNGGTMEKDAAHFQNHIRGEFVNRSMELGKLDIQGPRSREVLSGLVENIGKLDYYTFDHFDVLSENVLVSRTGYTGELGYEIYYPWEKAKELWKELLLNMKPAGLGVRDVLRIEMGYSLYGHELSEELSPLEAGLKPFIDWDKDFIGKGALLKEKEAGIKRLVKPLISDSRRSPRAGHRVWDPDGNEIGIVTSGAFSPILEKGIGLAFVSTAVCAGQAVLVGDEKNRFEAQITRRPIYQQGSLKS